MRQENLHLSYKKDINKVAMSVLYIVNENDSQLDLKKFLNLKEYVERSTLKHALMRLMQ
jgi:hypothetical protein